MIQGWVPDPLWAAAIAAAALAAAVLLNILLKLYSKKFLWAEGFPASGQGDFRNAAARRQKPERGSVPEQEFDLLELAEELGDRFAKRFQQKGIRFFMEFPEIAVSHVTGDRDGLCRVLETLLEAAAGDGKVTEVRLLFREMNRDARCLDLMVRFRRIGGSMDADTVVLQEERLVGDMGGQMAVSKIPAGGFDFSVFVTLKIQGGSRLDEE